jgi:hypothetical protein
MSQRAVFFASTGAGLLLFGLLASIQIESRALRNSLAERYSAEVAAVPVEVTGVSVIAPIATEPNMVTLPTVEIVGTARTLTLTLTPSVDAAPQEASVPCSDWRELGPLHVTDGTPSGSMRVRDLC